MKERKVFGISEATTTISDIERRGREAKNKSHNIKRTLRSRTNKNADVRNGPLDRPHQRKNTSLDQNCVVPSFDIVAASILRFFYVFFIRK